MASELAWELGQFPFRKVYPVSFRTEIASLSKPELEKRLLQVFLDTTDIAGLLERIGSAKVLRVYRHLKPPSIVVQIYASDLSQLILDGAVVAVQNDSHTKADGCVVTEADPSARTLARRADGGTC